MTRSMIPGSSALSDVIAAAMRHEGGDAVQHLRRAAELLVNPQWMVERDRLIEVAGFAVAAAAWIDEADNALADTPATVRQLLAA